MTFRQRVILVAQWLGLGVSAGVLSGVISALFLVLLDAATIFRAGHETIVYALPLAGLGIGWFYERHGQPIKGGTNLIIERVNNGGAEIPVRMTPMVLAGTVLTHLFGGSAGREGTAVQMGGSISDWLSHRLHLAPPLRAQVLAAGVAGGFAGVFGTPFAALVFALEFTTLRRINVLALVPAAAAAFTADLTSRTLGIVHTGYPRVAATSLSLALLSRWLIFAVAVALVTVVFVELTRWLKTQGERRLPWLPLRMFIGGLLVVLLWRLFGTSDYLGLGVPVIVRAFHDPELPSYAFAAKLLFTAITLGAGFIGGEVTPLFFVGAALGNVLAGVLDVPLALGAGVAMAAVFAAAANAPLALSIMAIELLGVHAFPHAAIVCVIAYLLSGRRGIYLAQRLPPGEGGLRLADSTSRGARRVFRG